MSIILNYAVRGVLISCGLQFIIFQLADMALLRHRPMWPVYLFYLVKTFAVVIISTLTALYPERIILQALSPTSNLLLTVIGCIFFVLTWSDEPLHALLVFALSEIMAGFFYGVILMVNYFEGRPFLEQTGPVHPLDLTIPLFMLLLFFLLRPILSKVMQFIGKLYFPFRKLLWVGFFSYILYSNMPAFWGNISQGAASFSAVQVVVILSSVVVGVSLLVLHYIRQQSSEQQFITMQVNLMQQRMLLTSRSQGEIKESSRIISAQMEELQNRMSRGEQIGKELVEEYIVSLETAKTKDYRGVFCKDSLVDELLCQIREEACRQGIKAEISLIGYDRGDIAEEDLVRLLYCLGYAAVQPGDNSSRPGENAGNGDKGWLTLSMSTSGEQFLIRICAPSFKLSRLRASYVRSLARNYHGGITGRISKSEIKKSGVREREKEIQVFLRCNK